MSRRYPFSRVKRIVSIGRSGIVTDRSPWDLAESELMFSQDMVAKRGFPAQRRGWKYLGSAQVVAGNLAGVYRARFQGRGVTRTIATDRVGGVYIVNDTGAGTTLPIPYTATGLETFVPRCMYRDQLILCDITGNSRVGALRYGGAGGNSVITVGPAFYTANEATITQPTWTGLELSQFYGIGAPAAAPFTLPSFLVDAVTSPTSFSISGVKASVTTAINYDVDPHALGWIVPCVSVYQAGTASNGGGGTFTGFGTRWLSDLAPGAGTSLVSIVGSFDTILVNDSGVYKPFGFSAISDTSANAQPILAVTKTSYDILRPPRFKDATDHKGSLCGVGVNEHPNRVYIAPPGWDMQAPPGAVLPWDPTVAITSPNRNFFALTAFDVPAPTTTDPIVALLSSPGPLLVLTRSNAYAIDGSYPDFSQRMFAAGAGCIDLRSAISLDEGQFWCGENGIYWSQYGRQPIDITRGKINREWRDLTSLGIDYCSTGISAGYLIVSVKTNGAVPVTRTYAYNLTTGAWETRLSNTNPRHMFTARVAGELEQLLMVQDSNPGRVINFTKALDGSGGARDDDGTSPAMLIRTGNIAGQPEDVEPETRMLDMAVHANILDSQGGTNTMDVNIVHEGGLEGPSGFRLGIDILDGTGYLGPGVKKAVTTIASHTYDGVQRVEGPVGRSGRQHAIELRSTATAATLEKLEVHEVAMAFRDRKMRT